MVNRPRQPATASTLQRAGIACQSCRARKVKCDAQSTPFSEGCSPCQRAGQECLLEPWSDGRRFVVSDQEVDHGELSVKARAVSRKYVDNLQRRIESLEALSQRTGNSTAAYEHRESNVNPPTQVSFCENNVTQLDNTSIAAPSGSKGSMSPNVSREPASGSMLPQEGTSECAPGDSPSFYGKTSPPYVVASPGKDVCLTPFDDADAVGIELDPRSVHLRDHLFQSFFDYQTVLVDIVSKESFLQSKAVGETPRCHSQFLENAMLACGTRLSTSKAVRALGSKYCDWAMEAALVAMSEPTAANLQGFLLLSEYLASQGNHRLGWMFCGIACRMLSDLGLHQLVSTSCPSAETRKRTTEADAAYIMLAACVVYEGVWTLYLGRPSCIPKSTLRVATSRCKEDRLSDSPWRSAWVGLCEHMAGISQALNDPSINDDERTSSLHSLLGPMEEWYENLPLEVSYNKNRLSSMNLAGYGMHTQYCRVQILLRQALARAHNTRKRRHSQISGEASPLASHDHSSVIIYRYALRVARLVVTYREVFGGQKIPAVMLDNAVVAATAMIAYLNNVERIDEAQHQTVWLRHLAKSIEAVQPHLPIAGRMLDSLRQACGDGPLSGMLPSATRKPSEGVNLEVFSQSVSQFRDPVADRHRDKSLVADSGAGLAWNCFDTGNHSDIFSSDAFDDFVHVLPQSDLVLSNFGSRINEISRNSMLEGISDNSSVSRRN